MADYITAADIFDALDLTTTDDVTMATVVAATTIKINNHCGRDFRPVTSSARYFSPTDGYCVRIDDATTVSAIATDDAADGLYSTSWSSSDWQAQPVGGLGPNGQTDWPYTAVVAVGSRYFSPSVYNRRPFVKVTAVWGWSAIPAPVKLAALMLAEEMFKAVREAPFGSANMADFGPIQIRGNRRLEQLLQPYETLSAHDGRFLVA